MQDSIRSAPTGWFVIQIVSWPSGSALRVGVSTYSGCYRATCSFNGTRGAHEHTCRNYNGLRQRITVQQNVRRRDDMVLVGRILGENCLFGDLNTPTASLIRMFMLLSIQGASAEIQHAGET